MLKPAFNSPSCLQYPHIQPKQKNKLPWPELLKLMYTVSKVRIKDPTLAVLISSTGTTSFSHLVLHVSGDPVSSARGHTLPSLWARELIVQLDSIQVNQRLKPRWLFVTSMCTFTDCSSIKTTDEFNLDHFEVCGQRTLWSLQGKHAPTRTSPKKQTKLVHYSLCCDTKRFYRFSSTASPSR